MFNADTWETPRPLDEYVGYVYGADELSSFAPPFPSPSFDRRCRLLVTAAIRRIWAHIPDRRSREAVELFETYLDDGDIAKGERAMDSSVEAHLDAYEAGGPETAATVIARIVRGTVFTGEYASSSPIDKFRYYWFVALCDLANIDGISSETNEEFHFRLFHDIFGNPFRPVVPDPSWRTEAVVALATGIYEDRAFEQMPVLADALEDAGCANPDVLAHCRSGGPHARGCWVVDLLLGKA